LPRQDIDEEAGEGVVPPGPADFAGFLIDHEVDPGTLQRLGHEQPRDAGAGDDNPKFPIRHHASHKTDYIPVGRSLSARPQPRQYAKRNPSRSVTDAACARTRNPSGASEK
jgi:hypothetical protein